MIAAHCVDCGATFRRNIDESWKRLCLPCWRKRKGEKTTAKERAPHVDPIVRELFANLPALIQLSHPDRHDGSQASTRVAQWLIDVRRRLRERGEAL